MIIEKENLSFARYCSKHFMDINSFNPCNSPMA